MTTYAVGDIQGCLEPLQCLLKHVNFDPKKDQLWSVGDMVNRGPQSLETLRFLKDLGKSAKIVLGNHDLHLLAILRGHKAMKPHSTMRNILDAPDRDELEYWLRQLPLVYRDKKLGYTMVHAGIPPQWTLRKALKLAKEVESKLQSDKKVDTFLKGMYGDQPDIWKRNITGTDRTRLITNYFTRMRFCTEKGQLDLDNKDTDFKHPPKGFDAWFNHPKRKTRKKKIIFGHWAALHGDTHKAKNVFALDTGCVWGNKMRLMCLEEQVYYECDCSS